ncbi:hypothetical protein BO78DRAFT_390490 [Aspergillus sclerotiicarbonarius CBS 121057]|uniref:Uncharacterized protein n=1 Tax=Aspergillus sclerotiicarbonarius (strain CBS 121057 / IBT 28362) TaxID=1448318 RepID=A0A319DWK2_ASPSB|nr:hypothetical protein BO78DRAFT_390490 [Aspergillus sclerotiicarbonarius CBS 121057]
MQPTGKVAWSVLLNVIHPSSAASDEDRQTGSLLYPKHRKSSAYPDHIRRTTNPAANMGQPPSGPSCKAHTDCLHGHLSRNPNAYSRNPSPTTKPAESQAQSSFSLSPAAKPTPSKPLHPSPLSHHPQHLPRLPSLDVSLFWSTRRGLRDIPIAFAKPRMNHHRSQLAQTLRSTVSTRPDQLIARGWDAQFVRDGSMADMTAGAVLAGSGNSGHAVRIVTDVTAVWCEGREDMTSPGGNSGNGELSSMAVVALVKFFVLEWSVGLNYQMYLFVFVLGGWKRHVLTTPEWKMKGEYHVLMQCIMHCVRISGSR